MLGQYYYHQTLRKAVTAFGRIFNEVYVAGRNDSRQRVPIVYGQRDKFLARIREEADLEADQQVAIRLPRMSFEISSIEYAADRQLQRQTRITQAGSTLTTRSRINAAVPYNISFELHVYAKTQDDGLQIVEQILPYFAPQFSLTIIPISGSPDLREDVPLTLVGVDLADEYEGDFTERRTIVYTLSFELRLNFYGPINDGEVIRTVTSEVETRPGEDAYNFRIRPHQEIRLNDSDQTPLGQVFDSGTGLPLLVLWDSDMMSSGPLRRVKARFDGMKLESDNAGVLITDPFDSDRSLIPIDLLQGDSDYRVPPDVLNDGVPAPFFVPVLYGESDSDATVLTNLRGPTADSHVPIVDLAGNIQFVKASDKYHLIIEDGTKISRPGNKHSLTVVEGRVAVSIVDNTDEFRFNEL